MAGTRKIAKGNGVYPFFIREIIAAILLTALLAGVAGCQGTPAPSEERPVLMGESPDWLRMSSVQRLVEMAPDDGGFERARIEYLFERLGASPHSFIRNGVAYRKTMAALHLRWKLMRYGSEVTTAEDFVDRIVSGSRKTGLPYQIQVQEAKLYTARLVFHNELKILSQFLEEYEQTGYKQMLEKEPEIEDNASNLLENTAG